MSAPEDDDRLSAYLDGELDELTTHRLERELAQDPDLRAHLDVLRRQRALVLRHAPLRAPAHLQDRILDALDDELAEGGGGSGPPWWRRPFGVPVEALAVAAAAVLVLWVSLPAGDPAGRVDPRSMEAARPAVRVEANPPRDPATLGAAPAVASVPPGWAVTVPAADRAALLARLADAEGVAVVDKAGQPVADPATAGDLLYLSVDVAAVEGLTTLLQAASGAPPRPLSEARPMQGRVRLKLLLDPASP